MNRQHSRRMKSTEEMTMTFKTTRRRLLLAGTAAGATITMPWVAKAVPEFSSNSPTTCRSITRSMCAPGKRRSRSAGDQRPARDPDLPQQPARRRHRHADPVAHRRDRVLHPVRADPVDARAARLDQRHRLRLQGLRSGLDGDGRRRSAPMFATQIAKSGLYAPSTRSGTTAFARSRSRRIRSTRPTISRASRSACR